MALYRREVLGVAWITDFRPEKVALKLLIIFNDL
jgi:hypothetical protein